MTFGFYPHVTVQHPRGEGVGHDSVEKVALDELHKRKIDLADYVYVLDVDGYVGESTKSEIAYASQHSIPIRYLSRSRVDSPQRSAWVDTLPHLEWSVCRRA